MSFKKFSQFKPINKDISHRQAKALYNNIKGGENMVNVTYEQLVSLRDNGKLTPGCYYRITDYQTVSTYTAGHHFDVIVLATSKNTISNDSKAIQSERLVIDKESITLNKLSTIKDLGDDSVNLENRNAFSDYFTDLNDYTFVRDSQADANTTTSFDFYLGNYGSLSNVLNIYAWKNSENQYIYTNSLTDITYVSVLCKISEITSDSRIFIKYSESPNVYVDFNNECFTLKVNKIRDTYFDNSNLEGWKLKYDIDKKYQTSYEARTKMFLTGLIKNRFIALGILHRDPSNPSQTIETVEVLYPEDSFNLQLSDNPNNPKAKKPELFCPTIVIVDSDLNNGVYTVDYEIPNPLTSLTLIKVIPTKVELTSEDSGIYTSAEEKAINTNNKIGFGTIYHMEDEFGNECDYDFKNVKYLGSEFVTELGDTLIFTFNAGTADGSIAGKYSNVKIHGNKIIFSSASQNVVVFGENLLFTDVFNSTITGNNATIIGNSINNSILVLNDYSNTEHEDINNFVGVLTDGGK